MGSVFTTNTSGPFFVTAAFLELLVKGANLRKGETSSVITISSAVSRIGLPMNVVRLFLSGSTFAYRVTKADVERLNKSMGAEFADQGPSESTLLPLAVLLPS
ncbi:hypothetical protein Hypma_001622 [Hypsizygus marmoreus]|uniref:Uncharacterized protein n=1 Tax=Hypsizygus marmoreus TaxID=39966 RepID=A0A369JCL8_HYPMA|nr:hypothetical protein Hypma_001622 [Hypsizygus marmoreus]